MRILLADDDVTSRSMLTAILQKWGYQVTVARDGTEAWQALQEADAPRLVILDWVMPGMDGVTLCSRLRESASPPYVILVTSKGEKGDVVRGLAAGADDYVTKPFDSDELRARVDVGRRMLELREALERRVSELQEAMAHIQALQGIIPICMHCRRIRTDPASWEHIEQYIQEHSDARFSHGICPSCVKEHYPHLT